MRVKIAYTVEMDEVEEEVMTIMQKSLSEIEKASDISLDATRHLSNGNADISTVLVELDKTRRALSKADQIIMDCYEILKAYQQTLQRIEQEVEDEKI